MNHFVFFVIIIHVLSYSWQCEAFSWKPFVLKIKLSTVQKPIIYSMIAILSINPIVYADDNTAVVDTVSVVKEEPKQKLSAADVLKSDIDPKVDALKDILFIIKLYPSYVESLDYASIRQSLRQDPVVEMRKTCRKLVKYLPEAQISSYNKNYNDMIDKINELDVVSIVTMMRWLHG